MALVHFGFLIGFGIASKDPNASFQVVRVGLLRNTRSSTRPLDTSFWHAPHDHRSCSRLTSSCALFDPRSTSRVALLGAGNVVSFEHESGDGDMEKEGPDSDIDEECDIEAPEGYCSKFDDLGAPAFEKEELVGLTTTDQLPVPIAINSAQNSASGDSSTRSEVQVSCIRLQALPDSCLGEITTPSDVESKIEQVKDKMDQYRRSDLYLRTWEPLEKQQLQQEEEQEGEHISGQQERFTLNVMQINTLAEGLSSAKSAALPFGKSSTEERKCKNDKGYGGFTEVPNPDIALDFSMRQWRLLEVVIGDCYREKDESSTDRCKKGTFDILALEEVDRFNGFFQPALAMFGYRGLFQPKILAPSIPLGYYSDGCALFWKEDAFDLMSQQSDGYASGTQVYLIATLRHKPSGRPIVAAVTHLKAKEGETNEKIRTMQAMELVQLLAEEMSKAAQTEGVPKEDIPVLLMGDFNSEPVGRGKTCVQSVIHRKEWPRFTSVYPLDPPPEVGSYTTWKTRGAKSVKRIIDYIFSNSAFVRGLECTHTLGIPKEEEIEPHGFPGFRYPSDHISIGARFKIDP